MVKECQYNPLFISMQLETDFISDDCCTKNGSEIYSWDVQVTLNAKPLVLLASLTADKLCCRGNFNRYHMLVKMRTTWISFPQYNVSCTLPT